ncbi:tRNA pseudouridine(55) synthase TruB [Treponema vincentii]|uniref:tRNA pseudouridine(55) synthase TruB n=1 Tax=Treponema vincentii TaxID=69710 RepID=UPI001E33C3B5|nr:tRNA pseudouridine(55) synthase TruB [Treponema vincentii]
MPKSEPQFIIPFAKPSGITSFTSLWQVKHALGTKKVGHTGTLDSFADGLLVLLSGRLTKLVPYITDFDKTYRVLFYFGKETDTLDPEGTVIAEKPLPVYADFIAAIKQLTGTIEQVPPVYSAVKQAGERLSDRIRRGEAVTVPPRTVTVYSIDIEEVFMPRTLIRGLKISVRIQAPTIPAIM